MNFSNIDTEQMKDSFWSDWLEEECFVSIYTVYGNCVKAEVQKISDLQI